MAKTSITVQDLREWQRKIQAVSALALEALIVEAFPYDVAGGAACSNPAHGGIR